jgi:hypothetical protein
MLNENNKQYLVRVLRKEYTQRLNEALDEVTVTDKSGNILVHPGLKVRHKSSGYEYTVAGIDGSNEKGLQVKLRLPEEPRFEPPPGGEEILGGPDDLYEDDLVSPSAELPLSPPAIPSDIYVDADAEEVQISAEEEVVFYVDEKDFEKNYEVE